MGPGRQGVGGVGQQVQRRLAEHERVKDGIEQQRAEGADYPADARMVARTLGLLGGIAVDLPAVKDGGGHDGNDQDTAYRGLTEVDGDGQPVPAEGADHPEGGERDHLHGEEHLGDAGGGLPTEQQGDRSEADPEQRDAELNDRRGVVAGSDQRQGVGARRDGDRGDREEVGEDQDPRLVAGDAPPDNPRRPVV